MLPQARIPQPKTRTSHKLIIRLPPPKSPFAFDAHSDESEDEQDNAQPGGHETPTTSSGASSGTCGIRRVRLIVRPPRSPSHESAEGHTDDSETDSLDDVAGTVTRPEKWLDECFFESPHQADFSRRSQSPEGIYYLPPQPKEDVHIDSTTASDDHDEEQ